MNIILLVDIIVACLLGIVMVCCIPLATLSIRILSSRDLRDIHIRKHMEEVSEICENTRGIKRALEEMAKARKG